MEARIMERLARLGVPQDIVDRKKSGLVAYVKNNPVEMKEMIEAILPNDEDAAECLSHSQDEDPTLKALFQESMDWLQWLMFIGNPGTAIEQLSGERGVCGVVWKHNDTAYRCSTCEEDPTRAICVSCFQHGDHKGHDYIITPVTVGCCDCGDVMAWKRSGFCSEHKGIEQTLPSDLINSIGPILDSLFRFWQYRLAPLQTVSEESPHSYEVREKLTAVVVELLLEFCRCSQCLLSIVSEKLLHLHGLMEHLVRVERQFFDSDVVETVHELLMKLLGEPHFKYEFAKAFLGYYPMVIAEAIKWNSDDILEMYPLLRTFSVQLFTMPSLTPFLLKEMNIFPVLLGCLENMFISCAGHDGRLEAVKWEGLYRTTVTVVENIKFVMSHTTVPIYVTHDWQDITRTWMRILSFVQGMYPQNRETSGIEEDDENENVQMPFLFGYGLGNIHSCLVGGTFSNISSEEVEKHGDCTTFRQELEDPDNETGRVSQECSVSSLTGRNLIEHTSSFAETKSEFVSISPYVSWLTFECLKTIDSWLVLDDSLSRFSSLSSTLKRTLFNFSEVQLTSTDDVLGRKNSITPHHSVGNLNSGQCLGEEAGHSGSDGISKETNRNIDLESLKVLSSSEWPDIVYDVSSQDISLHIPLHRLLSMVIQRSLRKCYVRATPCGRLSSATSEYFVSNILGGCHPYRFSSFLMEHPLRIRVFVAQVRADLWLRNGEAASVPCDWYHSACWSEKSLELDLFLLQCCAALAPPDLYVKRILERYGLSRYLKLKLEQSSEYEPILVQDMLTFIIQIVNERRFCGLTTAECLRREFVYKLSIGDATRSQLVKSLPPDLSKIGNFQQILDSVAVHSSPAGLNQGIYTLRLECWTELDLYHPRFNLRDLQIVEERYSRFCKNSAVTSQLPTWSKIYDPLSGIAQIATCKTILLIVRTVLFYVVFSDEWMASCARQGVLLTALHLLSLALNICSLQRASGQSLHAIPILEFASEEISSSTQADQSLVSLLAILMRLHEKEKNDMSSLCDKILKKFAELEPKCFIKLQKIAPEVVNHPSECNSNLDGSMTGLASDSEKCKAKARERQAAVLEYMKAQQFKFLESIKSTVGQEADVSKCGKDLVDNKALHDSKDLEEAVCSLCHDADSKRAVCFLVHLQKSRLLSFLDRGPVSWEHNSQSKEDHFSPGKSAISTPLLMRNILSSSHLELAYLVQSAVDSFASESQPHEINALLGFINIHFPIEIKIDCPLISDDVLEKTPSIENLEEHMYSLVQENLHTKFLQKDFQKYGDGFSTAGGTQERSSRSLLLGKYIASIAKEITNTPSGSENLHSRHNEAQSINSIRTFGPPDCDGINLCSCGHAVHQDCLERYLASLKDSYVRGISFEGSLIADLDKGEFLCPVCRGLANSALPTLPRGSEKVPLPPVFPNSTASYGMFSPSSSREVDSIRIQEAVYLMESADFVVGNKESLKLIALQRFEGQKSNLSSLSGALCSMYFPSKSKMLESGRISNSLLLWDVLKYSVASTEVAARSGKKSSTPTYGSDFSHTLSLLLNIVQSSRTENIPTTLLRFRGIQLFVESLCLGSANVEQNQQEGSLLSLLEISDSEAEYLDTPFWKRVSDPVLAHDPFSSLMWALYCLPTPFFSCKESFFCLVHIFYLVTITQAIVICCRKRCSLTEWGSKDSLITDICEVTRNHKILSQVFDSNYIDSCYEYKDAIRTVSCTFLRRCALLWDLVNSSASFPFSPGNQVNYGSVNHQSSILDIVEFRRLELMFNIPPIDIVINDGMSRSMATKWLHHFTNEFKLQGQSVLYCTPSIPFSLMVLPHSYEDLVHRYVKQQCLDCGAVLREHALCLLCGKLCAPNWETCHRESCQTHAMACGAGIGVFLLIRRTSILLQRSARMALWPSLYLDAFGEEDIDLIRGRPLCLNKERYAILNYMVASHGLDSSRVLDETVMAE